MNLELDPDWLEAISLLQAVLREPDDYSVHPRIVKFLTGRSADQYEYKVVWYQPNEWIGLCTEFPSLSHGDTDEELARIGIKRLVGWVLEDMASKGEDPPKPNQFQKP